MKTQDDLNNENPEDFLYSLNEVNYYEYGDIVDEINSQYEPGESVAVNRGKRKDFKHSNFICPADIDCLLERMQDAAFDEMGEFSEDYLTEITNDHKKELLKLITDFLESKGQVRFYGVDQIDEITITAGEE